MLLIITALVVLVLDQASKYGIFYGFVVDRLGYQGAANDLAALKTFRSHKLKQHSKGWEFYCNQFYGERRRTFRNRKWKRVGGTLAVCPDCGVLGFAFVLRNQNS